MNELVQSLLVLLVLFQIKHMFADYFLQTPKMLEGRGEYVHGGRAQHALIHVAGSALCLLAVGTGVALLAVMLIAEWIVHFHIDWGKARWSEARGHTPAMAGFWRAVGFDQMLHQLTYVVMAWAWVAAAAAAATAA